MAQASASQLGDKVANAKGRIVALDPFIVGGERLVVVDEAQWLNRECIEYLRHLHDEPSTRFALLLVGGDGCWEVLSREPMLRSRIYRRVRFGAMSAQTVLAVIPGYHAIYRDVAPELLLLIDDRYAHGSFREWASFTLGAQALCREQGCDQLTPDIIEALLELQAIQAQPA